MSGLDSRFGTSQKEFFQTFVLKIFNHKNSVTCNVTGCNYEGVFSETDALCWELDRS